MKCSWLQVSRILFESFNVKIMDGTSFAFGFAWQSSASYSFASAVFTQFFHTLFYLLFTAMASIAGAFGQSNSHSDDDIYGFVDVGVSNSSVTGILVKITESDIDASEAEQSRNDSDSLPPDSEP